MALTVVPAEDISSRIGNGMICVPVVHWMRCCGWDGGVNARAAAAQVIGGIGGGGGIALIVLAAAASTGAMVVWFTHRYGETTRHSRGWEL
jgi:hypothetical protein